MRRLRWSWAAALLAAGLTGLPASVTRAQEAPAIRSPILVVEADRLYRDSAFGQRVADEIAAQNAELAAENRRIEAELEAEELDLTELRDTMEPAAFRELADAFDSKVREIRREQEAKARAIARQQDESRSEFLNAAAPVLEDMMRDASAAVVLERRSVFLSLNAIDITGDALARIDEEIGDGTEMEEEATPGDDATPGDTGGITSGDTEAPGD